MKNYTVTENHISDILKYKQTTYYNLGGKNKFTEVKTLFLQTIS